MWRTFWLASALALVSLAAQAADSQQRYAAHGLGRLSCKRFVEICEKRGEDCKLTGTWIDGYVTAFNALNKDTFDILPWQPPELVAEGAFNICRQNPEAAVVETITEVMRVLLPQRIQTAAERVKIGEGKGAVYLYRDTVRALQQRLINAGHLKGAADGAFGPGTKAAVESFQRALGLESSGMPDQQTMVALFYAGVQQQRSSAPQNQPSSADTAPPATAPAVPPGGGAGPALDLDLIPQQP